MEREICGSGTPQRPAAVFHAPASPPARGPAFASEYRPRMARRPDLTSSQRKIVNRYYLHKDTIVVTRLQEIVSDLYLAEGKKADALWKRAEKALAGVQTEPPLPKSRLEQSVGARDVTKLAELVGELSAR